MKDIIINNTINFIAKYNNYDEIKIEELRYGLVSIYLLITKLIIICIISALLGIFKEMVIFTLIYIPIRAVSFGLHATKSWICLITSSIIFIILPLVAIYISIPTFIKSGIGIICIILLFKNSPADTYKRPIVNKKRRLFFKYCSTLICIIYIILSVFIKNNFISNVLILTILVQCFLTSPLIYKIFKLPYNNYKNYN